MFRALRRFVTAVLLLLLVLLSGFTVARVAGTPLSDTVPTRELWQQLAEEDVATRSEQDQKELVLRFEAQSEASDQWIDRVDRLNAREQQQVKENLLQLAPLWYEQKCNEYFALPEAQRSDFLDQQIGRFEHWMGIPSLGRRERAKRPGSGNAMAGMMLVQQQLQRWIEDAEPTMQPKLSEFQVALQSRLIARFLDAPTGP